MDLISLLYDIQYPLNTLAAIACILLCAEYIFIVRIRKPPYFWSSYSVAFVLFTLACDRLLKISQPHVTISLWQLASQSALNALLLLAALMIPRVRKATHKRPRFNQLQAINENLNYNQRLFQSYLDEAPVLAYIKDKDRRITHANAGFARLFGESAASVIGKTDLWGEPTESQARDLQVLAGGGEKELTKTLHLKTGESTIIDIRFPLKGPENESLLGGIAIDITNQLKRKNRIEVFASIVDLCPDAIYSHDQGGRILTWNPAAETMFGYTREEMLGQSVKIITAATTGDTADQGELEQMLDFFRRDPSATQHFESVRASKDGSRKSVLVAAALVPGATITIAVITRDITQKKEMEKQIKALHDALEVKVQELSATNISLQKARDEALEAEGAKSTFVANASHELRTPLSGIIGMSEIMALQSFDHDSRRLVGLLQQSAEELMQVIDDILELAKLEAGKATIEEEVFLLSDLLSDCARQFAPALSNKKLAWSTCIADAVPNRVCADRSVIKRILSILITNAVAYTTSGIIDITISRCKDSDQADDTNEADAAEPSHKSRIILKFSVTDTGIGIDKDILPLLFTPFVRTSQSIEGTPGKGLGLVLCRQLTALIQGQIGCSSEKSRGSTFWFSARVQQVKVFDVTLPKQADAPTMAPHELAQYIALSVDDSPIVSRLTMRQLAILGVQARAAATGIEAIEKAGTGAFDVILLDMCLPDMTGPQAAKEIRRLEQCQGKLPSVIIALTGYSADELRQQADMTDMVDINDFLEKPVNIDQLRTSLIRALCLRGV